MLEGHLMAVDTLDDALAAICRYRLEVFLGLGSRRSPPVSEPDGEVWVAVINGRSNKGPIRSPFAVQEADSDPAVALIGAVGAAVGLAHK